jgi:hypothetical protein
MNMAAMFGGNLLLGLLLAWACQRMGEKTFLGGAMTGGLLFLLFYAGIDLMFLSMMNMYASNSVILVDVVTNAIWGAMAGGVAALVLGRPARTA